MRLRELDVLESFLLADEPLVPVWVAVGHAAEDDLGNLQARVAEANWREDKTSVSMLRRQPDLFAYRIPSSET